MSGRKRSYLREGQEQVRAKRVKGGAPTGFAAGRRYSQSTLTARTAGEREWLHELGSWRGQREAPVIDIRNENTLT
jgi:hypothetical protein